MQRFFGVIAGFVFPPLGVYLARGFALSFWINLVFTLLFYVPGQIHALWVVAHTREDGRRAPDGTQTFVALLLGAFLPPLGVAGKVGFLVPAFWINVVLTLFFWIPGSIHALWVITAED